MTFVSFQWTPFLRDENTRMTTTSSTNGQPKIKTKENVWSHLESDERMRAIFSMGGGTMAN
jgi:hypothetical protein